jgi:hypothetical protein
VLGCILGAVGFYLWAGKVTELNFSTQQWYIIVAGAGMGFMLGPASTDAVNRASRLSYGEATGITQTVRNYAASMGLAILGTISVAQTRNHLYNSLVAQGVPAAQAHASATHFSASGSGSGSVSTIPQYFRIDFAQSTQTVFYVMAGIMAVAAVIGLIGLRGGVQEEAPASEPDRAATEAPTN